jgi:hypothetical protein
MCILASTVEALSKPDIQKRKGQDTHYLYFQYSGGIEVIRIPYPARNKKQVIRIPLFIIGTLLLVRKECRFPRSYKKY